MRKVLFLVVMILSLTVISQAAATEITSPAVTINLASVKYVSGNLTATVGLDFKDQQQYVDAGFENYSKGAKLYVTVSNYTGFELNSAGAKLYYLTQTGWSLERTVYAGTNSALSKKEMLVEIPLPNDLASGKTLDNSPNITPGSTFYLNIQLEPGNYAGGQFYEACPKSSNLCDNVFLSAMLPVVASQMPEVSYQSDWGTILTTQ